MTSLTALKKPTIVSRVSGEVRVAAAENNTEKMTSGSIVPSAAVFTGFVGTRSVSHCPKVGSCFALCAAASPDAVAEARSEAAIAGSISRRAKIGGERTAATIAEQTSRARKSANVRAPIRPTAAAFDADATPTTNRENTSGTTVILMAFTQSTPTGCRNDTADRASSPDAETAMPRTKPAPSANRTRLVRDIAHRKCGALGDYAI